MSYHATWDNGDAGRLVPPHHRIRDNDLLEISAAINRRLMLGYQYGQDASSQVAAGLPVRAASLASQYTPFTNLRSALLSLLNLPVGSLGGTPFTPDVMQWLWPEGGPNADAVIVVGAPQAGQVCLLAGINGTDTWTDTPIHPPAGIRAVHVNELRRGIELLTRGRWHLPVYSSAGIITILPDSGWMGSNVAKSSYGELRALGFVAARLIETNPRGLQFVTVRPGSCLTITATYDCQMNVYRCLRPMRFVDDPPTWNRYHPTQGGVWAAAGGLGDGDSILLGSVTLSANQPASLGGSAVAEALQAMIDGAEQNFLFTRVDTGPETVRFACQAVIDFDLNSPPN